MDVLTELEANCSALWNSSGILAGTGAGPIVGVPGDLGPWYCVYEWCIVLASKQGMQPIWMIHWEMGNGSLPLAPAWKILWRSHHPAKSSHTKHILNLHGSKLTQKAALWSNLQLPRMLPTFARWISKFMAIWVAIKSNIAQKSVSVQWNFICPLSSTSAHELFQSDDKI